MMKKLKFSNKNEKYCSHCVYGKYLEYSDEVFCCKKGFVDKFSKCIKYKYDPLKRQPSKTVVSSGFTAEDFKL